MSSDGVEHLATSHGEPVAPLSTAGVSAPKEGVLVADQNGDTACVRGEPVDVEEEEPMDLDPPEDDPAPPRTAAEKTLSGEGAPHPAQAGSRVDEPMDVDSGPAEAGGLHGDAAGDDEEQALSQARAAAADCRLLVRDLSPKVTRGFELAIFLGGAVLSTCGHTAAVAQHARNLCVAAGLLGDGEAIVAFRTPLGATGALRLSGLEWHGSALKLHRPSDYVPPADGDPVLGPWPSVVPLALVVGDAAAAGDAGPQCSAEPQTSPNADPVGQQQQQEAQQQQQDPQAQGQPASEACADDAQQAEKDAAQQAADEEKEARAGAGKPLPSEEKLSDNHYEVLGLTSRATAVEIKKAYFAKCRVHHPDKCHGDPHATSKFQRISEAYQILATPAKRAQYDATLVMQKACGSLGVQTDPRAVAFVQRHSATPGWEVASMQVEAWHVTHIVGKNGVQLHQLKVQSATDILVLQRPNATHAQVLIAGPPQCITVAKTLMTTCIAQLTGSAAPADGVVCLVPAQFLPKMPQVSSHFQGIFMQTGAVVRFASADRIIVQGGMRVSQAVVQLQWLLDWRVTVLLPTGVTLDAWSYAHYCEVHGAAALQLTRPGVSAGEAFQYLLPPSDPDAQSVRKVLALAISATEDMAKAETLVSLATRALLLHAAGRPLTSSLVRCSTSVAVHAEHAALSNKEGAPLLCALAAAFPTIGAQIAPRFANMPLFQTLRVMNTVFGDACQGLVLRSRGYVALCDAVTDIGVWVPWSALLRPDTPLGTWWKWVQAWFAESQKILKAAPPPDDWLAAEVVMFPLIRACIGPHQIGVDVSNGVRRHEKPASKGDDKTGAGQSLSLAAGVAIDGAVNDEVAMTLVEHVEEAVLRLTAGEPSKFVPMGAVLEEIRKLAHVPCIDDVCQEWLSSKSSFEVKNLRGEEGDGDEWVVRLAAAARTRATTLQGESDNLKLRLVELRVAEEVLPKLSANAMPQVLRCSELAALLCGMARNQFSVPENLPVVVLKRICTRADTRTLLFDCAPFTPAMLMRACVTIERQRRQKWEKESLDMLLQAAALDMHAVEDRPRAALPTAAVALWAAARRPFEDRLNAGKCLLVPSSALRLQVELSEGAALSADASLFRAFAQTCVWLAHLVVTAKLPSETRNEVLQAFRKLARSCVEVGKMPDDAPTDPEGLCRLTMAVALVVRDEKNVCGPEPVEALARVCMRGIDEASHWKPQQLAVLASAFSAAHVAHSGILKKIGNAAERHLMLGTEWNTDQLMKLLNSAYALELTHLLEGLVRGLHTDAALMKLIKDSVPRDLPLMLTIATLLGDDDLVSELAKRQRDKLRDLSLSSLIVTVQCWSGLAEQGHSDNPDLVHFRSILFKEAAAAAHKKAPNTSELQTLVTALADDHVNGPAQLAHLGSSPALLSSLPSADPKHCKVLRATIDGLLTPFVLAGAEVPRLEAAFAERVLVSLERGAPLVDLAPLVVALPTVTLITMPALIAALAERMSKTRLPGPTSKDAGSAREICEHLVLTAVALPRSLPASGDSELDSWVDAVDKGARDSDSRGGSATERRLDSVDSHMSKRMPKDCKHALGPRWLEMLLIRSRRVSWSGGKTVLLAPPRPCAAVLKLLEKADPLLSPPVRCEAEVLEAEPIPDDPEPSPPPQSAPGRTPAPVSPAPSAATAASNMEGGVTATVGAPGASSVMPPPPPVQRVGAATLGGIERESSRTPPPGKPSVAGDLGTGAAVAAAVAAPPTQPLGSSAVPRPSPGSLVVAGGRDAGIADTINGTYKPSSANHNRAVYRRIDPPSDSRVLLYWWDERDGEDQSGWWFGPEVGGDEVWVHHKGIRGSAIPPAKGWRILHSDAVDPFLTITKVEARTNVGTTGALSATPTARTAAAGGRPGPSTPPPIAGTRPRPAAGPASAAAVLSAAGGRPSSAAPATTPATGQGRIPAPVPLAGVGLGNNGPVIGRRPRETAVTTPQAEELREWLRSLDGGVGAMLQYFDVLAAEFDCDLSQISAAKVHSSEEKFGVLGVVDPSFWSTVKVAKASHKLLFAKGIARL